MKIKAGIIGSTGYAGQQLVWLLHAHSEVELTFLASSTFSDQNYSSVYPHYSNFVDMPCLSIDAAISNFSNIDVLFLALPHGTSFDFVKKALKANIKIIDLGADFRLHDQSVFEKWYQVDHQAKDLLKDAIYGLPELHKDQVMGSNLIANPGCYTTASILALAPLCQNKLIDKHSIIIDAKSGVTGAGRKASVSNNFSECNESIKAYGIGTHRHTPEIEQELSLLYKEEIQLNFTPHLVPMQRGILATCYGNLNQEITLEKLKSLYSDYYKDAPFVRLVDHLPETRFVKNSNFCDIYLILDTRTNRIIVVSAIDNLIKGAAGQAVQNMNIIFNIPETTGLKWLSMAP